MKVPDRPRDAAPGQVERVRLTRVPQVQAGQMVTVSRGKTLLLQGSQPLRTQL